MPHATRRRVLFGFAISLTLLVSVVVTVALLLSGPQCSRLVLFGRRDCLLLRSPAVWFAHNQTVPSPQPEVLAPLPLPSQATPNAIWRSSSDGQAAVERLARTKAGGYIRLSTIWAQRANDENTLAVVPENEPYIGEFEMGAFMPEPPVYIIACLVDFIQRPCTPGAPISQTITLSTDQIARVPIEIHGLQRGLHDLAVVRWKLLDLADVAPTGALGERGVFSQIALRKSLAVGGDTTPITPTFETLPLPLHVFGLEGLALNPWLLPWEKQYGGLLPFLDLQARPGQKLKLYLHVFNTSSVPVDYALTAFVNQQQVPLNYHNRPHQPLFVRAKGGAWYPLPIEITAPDTPGEYELVILGEPFPTRRIDLAQRLYDGLIDFSLEFGLFTSYRIRLSVDDSG
jgi:hypothetical protein